MTSISFTRLKKRLAQSFTLLELSVALAVSGVLLAGGISAYKASNPKLRSDLKKLAKIEEALQQFFTTNGRLPFPARPGDYNGTTYYLKEYKIGNAIKYSKATYKTTSSASVATSTSTQYCNSVSCTAYAGSITNPASQLIWGVVPTRTLGLPDDYAYDNQGKNFEYITDLQLATNNGMTFANSYSKANYETNQQGKYNVLYTTTNASYTNFSMSLFPITITNANTAKAIEATTNNVAYVLLSKQKQSCYWNNRAKNATITNSTIPTDNTKFNCQANSSYANGNFDTISFYQGYSKTFDNVLKYKTLPELIYKSASEIENRNEITQGKIVSYQPRDDAKLQTDSKNLIGAINEEKNKIEQLEQTIQQMQTTITALTTRLDNMKSANSTSKMFLMGATSQANQPTTYSQNQVYMENGTLYLTKTTDLAGTANNKPALIVGSTDTGAHLEFDGNEIHAKNNGTTVAPLYLNDQGGDVYFSGNANASLRVGKSGGSSKIYLNGRELSFKDTVLTKAQVCEYVYPVGSIYMSYSKTDNPNNLLGCGTWELLPRDYYIRTADKDGATNYRTLTNVPYGTFLQDVALPNIKGAVNSIFQGKNWDTGYSGAITPVNSRSDNSWEDNTNGYTGFSFDANDSNNTYVDNAVGGHEARFKIEVENVSKEEITKNNGCTAADTNLVRTIYICNKANPNDFYKNLIDSCKARGYQDIDPNITLFVAGIARCACYSRNPHNYVQPMSFNVLIWRRTA